MSDNHLAMLIIGISWLLLSAAVCHYKITSAKRRGKEHLIDSVRRDLAVVPHWLGALAIAIVLPLAPIVAVLGWIERRGGKC
jgi:hypothetical protein